MIPCRPRGLVPFTELAAPVVSDADQGPCPGEHLLISGKRCNRGLALTSHGFRRTLWLRIGLLPAQREPRKPFDAGVGRRTRDCFRLAQPCSRGGLVAGLSERQAKVIKDTPALSDLRWK